MVSNVVHPQIPSAEIVLLGDFNAHHGDWLSSSDTDHAGDLFIISHGHTALTRVVTPT